jgi:hypothetical protein
MTDEQAEPVATKRPPGRPRGSTSKKRHERQPTHRGIERMPRDLDEDDLASFEPTPFTPHNPLAIDKEIIWKIEHEYDFVLQWAAYEIAGMPQPERINGLKRNRWQEVTRTSFGGLLRPYFTEDKDRLTCGGQVCMAVPMIIWRKLRQLDDRAARDQRAHHERAHSVEGINVPGGSHESALAHNKHRHDYSPYNPDQKIPD